MLLERTDLHKKLKSFRKKDILPEDLLKQVKKILEENSDKEADILFRLRSGDVDEVDSNNFQFEFLETDRIFHISQIKKICIDYRLRFLSTKYFKGVLPNEAISATKDLEKLHGLKLQGFKIVAPANYFRLENADDPILFAPIGNNYFYLIHKWGKDLHPLRRLAMWPLRNFENLVIFSFVSGFFLTFGIREVFFSKYQDTSEFLVIFMYTFKALIALLFFYGISLGKNFSSGNWNSKFYNA